MKNETSTFLSVRDLAVEYTSEGKIIHAVNGISFDLERGKTLGLVGETGAGKTSVAKALLRILPDPPAKIVNGQILLCGQDLLRLPEEQMRKIRGKRISMIFQDPMTALNPVMRVGNQIAEAIRLHDKTGRAEARKRAVEMLEMVGIPADRYQEYPHQFSGGMKQRVVIAMALACEPELLLADEPTTALDVTIQAQVLDMIRALKEERNTSMIMITHDLGIVGEVCDDVAIVYAGEIVEYGPKEELFDDPRHPYTIGLFGAVPKLEEDVDRLSPVAGMMPDPMNLPDGCHFWPRCPHAAQSCRSGEIPYREIRRGHFCKCCRSMEKEERDVDSVD